VIDCNNARWKLEISKLEPLLHSIIDNIIAKEVLKLGN